MEELPQDNIFSSDVSNNNIDYDDLFQINNPETGNQNINEELIKSKDNTIITNDIMEFIRDTKEGKYTLEKPILTNITYIRMDVQEGDASNVITDCHDDVIFYGLSY